VEAISSCVTPGDREHSHWPSDVFEFFLSEIGEAFLKAITHLAVGVLGKTDTARISNAFKARGNVDAVAHQVAIALLDQVAQMDADAELDATLRRKTRVALDHAILHLDCAANGIDDASDSMRTPSPVRLTMRPLCTAMVGSIRSLRSARRRASVRSSSDPASLLNPTTSAARRLRVSGSPPWQSLHHTPD
jgi:hypothetical protein